MEVTDGPLTVESFCRARGLDPRLITSLFRLYDRSDYGGCIGMPVFDAAGALLYHTIRTPDGRILRDPAGGEYTLYGIHLLSRDYGKRPILIVQGQSDTWALAQHGWPAVGVVGWGQWKAHGAEYAAALGPLIVGRQLLAWEEPDDTGRRLIEWIARDFPTAWLVRGDAHAKDPCELHQREGKNFRAALVAKLQHAVTVGARAAAIARMTAAPAPKSLPSRTAIRWAATDREFDALLERARGRSLGDVFAECGVELYGRGTERRARCPFHDDHEPSLRVNVAKNLWYCDPCGFGGDGIAFLQRYNGLRFHDAVRHLVP